MNNWIQEYDHLLNIFTNTYYSLAKECIDKFLNDAYYRRERGEINPVIKNNLTGNDLANNFHYLYSLLVEAYYKYVKDGMTEVERAEFYSEYRIEEIKKNFLCYGCNIEELITSFTGLFAIDDPTTPTPRIYEGIGYWGIDVDFKIS